MVQGAKSSCNKGAKAQYYPINPPESAKYNPDRNLYTFSNIPLRTQEYYWETINALEAVSSQTQAAKITKTSGISRLPLCAASPAFVHPVFFPLDPFHLFYENCMAFIWDLWTTLSPKDDLVHLPQSKAEQLGQLVVLAMESLPPEFCGPVRDPFLKRQSQYKVYEWMALLHWYIIPIGIELEFQPSVLENFAGFVGAIEFAMTIQPRSFDETQELYQKIAGFLHEFEILYIGNNPENILRARLCMFQLIHVPMHIVWYGSIRLGSQATVERSIGEIGHKIHSKKAPFAEMANIIYEREMCKILCLYFPILKTPQSYKQPTTMSASIKPIKLWAIQKKGKGAQADQKQVREQLQAICNWLGEGISPADIKYKRWGKIKLKNGRILQSCLSISKGQSTRFQKWFEANADSNQSHNLIFGEALAFYEIYLETTQLIAVYHPLGNVKSVLGCTRGQWLPHIAVLNVEKIIDIVGIWLAEKTGNVYILRKHPGLALLTADECGKDPELEEGEDPDDLVG
ncbi:hypothetical protein BD779DRAFT_1446976 [Infundibulicybe gibba]|nr:hypothetical protein BD779DRAFT_1446976 [Infundibulicybe gibba]